jgi:ketosteroid isomerase-like protein
VRLISEQNVEIVRRMYDAYARGDFEASLSCLDPAIEFSQPAMEPGGGTYHGHEGVIEAMTRWTGAWDDYRIEVDELTDFGARVLARTRHRGRGKGSGVEVEQQVFQLWTLCDDKVVRGTMYYEESEALEAVGLSE